MRTKVSKLVHIEITPNQLRKLADRLEALWAKARLGDDVPREEFVMADRTVVRFTIDQEEKYDEERRAKSTLS